MKKSILRHLLITIPFILTSKFTLATIVEFQTSEGDFQVNLYDETTPKTVENFLSYVDDGAYVNNVIHRSISSFIVQAGGYTFEGAFPLEPISTSPAVINEPVYSNIRGTIAMAKLPSDVNSATSQWFFNLANNSSNLDLQNGGFTAFGEVIGDGMNVVDQISQIQTCSEIPMPDYTSENCSNVDTPGVENFVTIYNIVIIDSSESTASNLTPVKNTLLGQGNGTPDNGGGNSSSGGSFAWFMLAFLSLVRVKRCFK